LTVSYGLKQMRQFVSKTGISELTMSVLVEGL